MLPVKLLDGVDVEVVLANVLSPLRCVAWDRVANPIVHRLAAMNIACEATG